MLTELEQDILQRLLQKAAMHDIRDMNITTVQVAKKDQKTQLAHELAKHVGTGILQFIKLN